MPIIIPEFVQFQGVLYPLRGLWNSGPPEGDRFVNAEIDWGSPGLLGVSCVQFQLSGNSPVAFSQIVAMSVDNSRCGSSVDFIYPDSGFVLTVPAFNQGVYPVFTNALMFYASAPLATLGDITICQILNSNPPPVAIQPASEQEFANVAALLLQTNQSVPLVPAAISGTLNGFNITYGIQEGTGSAQLSLIDGTGRTLWSAVVYASSSSAQTGEFQLSGLTLRFQRGINFVVSASTLSPGGEAIPNVFYSVP